MTIPPEQRGAERIFRVNSEEHPTFDPPDEEQLLWRYTNTEKFLAMLATSTLWFSRSTLLGDPMEGSLGRLNREAREELYGDCPELLAQIGPIFRDVPNHLYVSCWYQSDYESAAMWSLYAERAGVAIVTNRERIERSIDTANENEGIPSKQLTEIFIGRVNYVDLDQAFIPENQIFAPIMHKRQSFDHEREVRMVVNTWPTGFGPGNQQAIDFSLPSPSGLAVPVALNELISEVRVSPGALPWIGDAIRETVGRFGVDCEVIHSDLDVDRIF